MKTILLLTAALTLAGCATPAWMANYPRSRNVVRHEPILDEYGRAIAFVVERADGRVVVVDKFGRTLARLPDAR